eukprot:38675_1
MFAGPRKSITSLFLGDAEQQLIGREISHPTKAVATRAWAENQKMNTTNKAEHTDDNILQTELRHAHMSLLAERARVQDLESQLKSLMEQKYSNQSNIIDQLRTSQDKLREQLHLVIQSKMDLCESTSLEIERLRIIIAELTSHLTKAKGGASTINIDAILSKYNMNSQSNRHDKYNDQDHEDRKDNEQEDIDNRGLEEQLNNPRQYNEKLPPHLRPFPHRDISRIDIRTITKGDLITYPDPFAAVDLKYTGYKYLRDTNKWTKFTSSNISSTVFETRLGNHENIIGLEQAVLSMTKGEVARVWVPSRLGYGVHGAEPLIPPNTDLVFELTLVEIRNDFAISNQDDSDPLDPHQLAHIQQDDDGINANPMSETQYAAPHSQLTTNNLNTLNNMNNMNQNEETMPFQHDNQYNAQENELLGYDVDEYGANQQNSFQVL